MVERLIDRAGGFASQLGLLAGRGAKKAVLDIRELARQRAIEKREELAAKDFQRKQDLLSVDAAIPHFHSALSEALEGYRPVLSQSDVDAADWSVPREVTELLQDELDRIRVIVSDLMKSVGFPLSSDVKEARERILPYWDEAWRAFEEKAFAHLTLPDCFEFVDGHVGFERVSTPIYDKGRGHWSYIGQKTGYHYAQPPVLSV